MTVPQVKVTQSDTPRAPSEARGAYAPHVPGGYAEWSAADARYREARAAVAGARVSLDSALTAMESAAVELARQEAAPGIPLYTQAPGYNYLTDPRLTVAIAEADQ